MLDNIILVLEEFYGQDKYHKRVSKCLLNKIESNGMLPPFNQHDFQMDGDNADYKSVIYRTWEEE
jgi:hypothetical protein